MAKRKSAPKTPPKSTAKKTPPEENSKTGDQTNSGETPPENNESLAGKFQWSFSFDVINDSGNRVEEVKSSVVTDTDNEREAYIASVKQLNAKYKTRLDFTQKFTKVKL